MTSLSRGLEWTLACGAVLMLAVVCFIGSRHGDFVFDDSEAIVTNEDVDPGSTSWEELLSHDFWGNPVERRSSHKSYRPLTVLSFQLDYWLAGGRHPYTFHVTNILLHALVSLLYLILVTTLLRLASDTSNNDSTGCNVAGVVGRAELCSAACVFLALLTYMHLCSSTTSYSGPPLLVIVLVLTASAMLFKEQGITVIGLCSAYDIIIHQRVDVSFDLWIRRNQLQLAISKAFVVRQVTLLVFGVLVLWLRYSIMVTGPPTFQTMDNPASFSDSWLTRTLSYNYVYSLNALLLVYPQWLCYDWAMGCIPLLTSIADYRVLAVLALWAGLGGSLLMTLLRKPGQEKREIVMSLVLLVVPFLPATNILFRVGFVLAERVLYLPSSGYCLLVAIGLHKLYSKNHVWGKKLIKLSFVLFVVSFVWRSRTRTSDWLNEDSLFTAGASICPLNAKVHYNIGKVRSDQGELEAAEKAYREAVRLYPDYDQALNNLGNLLKDRNRSEEAEDLLLKAVQVSPEFAAAWMNLGVVQAQLNKMKEAEQSYLKATTYRKKYPDAWYNLGNLTQEMARKLPDCLTGRCESLGMRLSVSTQTRHKEAEAAITEAMRVMPREDHFPSTLGVILGQLGRYKEGEVQLLKAIGMNPGSGKHHANLGVIYHLWGNQSLAEQYYRRALEIDPHLTETKVNLNKLRKKENN